jgi:hypothetical protein
VTARIKAANQQSCSLENHLTPPPAPGAPVAPGAGSVEAIAVWWSTGRDHTEAPAPTPADLDAADRRLRETRR